MKDIVSLAFLMMFALGVSAQFPKDNPAEDVIRTTNFPKLKELVMTDIPGAPVLRQPQRIDGSQQEIRTCKHGLCYPAVHDWNHDGKPDLLLGEFSTGDKENNIRVYINEGTKSKPKFSGKYFYAKDEDGDTISNYQWCCIGIHPRFVDITGDGRLDMLSGQYNPGLISLWRGTDKGFAPREYVPQEGYVDGKRPAGDENPESPENGLYWNYTSAGFGDYNGDGLIDLFVGGSAGLRMALNEGTKENPRFGLRKYLYSVDGNVLSVDPEHPMAAGGHPRFMKTYMTPVDWDGDGVLDILLTYDFASRGSHAILFYKGVNTNLGLRFKHPVPLFTTADGSKELPGCQPMICVYDVNGDGVNDIVMGISIPTINYEVQDSIAWGWIHDFGIEMPGKDAGEYYMYTTRDSIIAKVESNPGFKSYYLGKLNDYKYLDLRHRGYVFVFYGTRNKTKAVAETLHVEAPKPIETTSFKDADANEPLTYKITSETIGNYETDITVYLTFKDGWHGYSDSKATTDMGMIPTKVTIEAPEGVGMMGQSKPYTGNVNIYTGQVKFMQKFFTAKAKKPMTFKVHIDYQACDANICLMPKEHVVEYVVE